MSTTSAASLHAQPSAAPGTLPPVRPATLSDAMPSEWTKIRTLRSTFFSLAAAIAIVVGIGTLISYESGANYSPDNGTWDPTTISLAALIIGQLAIAVLGP